MSEIELLTEQIVALQPVLEQHKLEVGLFFVGMFISLLAGFILMLTYGEAGRILGLVLISSGIIFTLLLIMDLSSDDNPVNIRNELEEKRYNATRIEIKSLSCEELRTDILEKLEADSIPEWITEHNDFERDLYYHKCEIPLREEVIKLGEQ